MNPNHIPKRAFIFGISLMLLFVGCEELPKQAPIQISPVEDSVLNEGGLGVYNWNLGAKNGFEVEGPSGLSFVQQLDREKIAANLRKVKFEERISPIEIPGVDDDVLDFARQYLEPQLEAKPIAVLPKNELIEMLAIGDIRDLKFALSSDGKRMVLIGKDIILWDIDSHKQTIKLDNPLSNKSSRAITNLHLDEDGRYIAFCNGKEAIRIAVEDGKTEQCTLPANAIYLAVARNATQYAVLCSDGSLHHLDSQFQVDKSFTKERVIGRNIDISPDGKTVIANTTKGILRWHGNRPVAPELITFARSEAKDLSLHAASNRDFRVDATSCAEFSHEETTDASSTNKSPYQLNHRIVSSFLAAHNNNEWLVLCCEKPLESGTKQTYVVDVSLQDSTASVPFELGNREPLAMELNATGDTIALLAPDQLQVFRRRVWVDAVGLYTARKIADLADANRFEQLEKISDWIRRQPVLRGGLSGEMFFCVISEELGRKWRNAVEAEGGNKELMVSLKKWLRSQSQLAILSYGQSLYRNSTDQRGYHSYNRQVVELLSPMLESHESPMAAYAVATHAQAFLGGDPESYAHWTKDAIERFPDDTYAMRALCLCLNPTFQSGRGSPIAMVNAITSRYPKPAGDLAYCKTAIGYLLSFGTKATLRDYGFNTSRILDSVDLYLETLPENRKGVETLIELAKFENRSDLVKRLAQYHARRFTMPSELVQAKPDVPKAIQEAIKEINSSK